MQLAGELLDMARKRDDKKAAVAAFVTFESVAQAQACAMSYKGHTNWLCRKLLQPSHLRLESIFPLQVRRIAALRALSWPACL